MAYIYIYIHIVSRIQEPRTGAIGEGHQVHQAFVPGPGALSEASPELLHRCIFLGVPRGVYYDNVRASRRGVYYYVPYCSLMCHGLKYSSLVCTRPPVDIS